MGVMRLRRLKKVEKMDKTKKTLDEKEDDLVFCITAEDSEQVQEKEKVSFAADVKLIIQHAAPLPTTQEMGMLCTIDGDSFYTFTKNVWIDDSGAFCYIVNNDISMFDVEAINKSVQGSSSNKMAMKKGKIYARVGLVDVSKKLHTLMPKYCVRVGASLFSLTFKLS